MTLLRDQIDLARCSEGREAARAAAQRRSFAAPLGSTTMVAHASVYACKTDNDRRLMMAELWRAILRERELADALWKGEESKK